MRKVTLYDFTDFIYLHLIVRSICITYITILVLSLFAKLISNICLFFIYSTPLTTGTSVLGLVFNGGVILAADTAGFYGSMMRFNDCPRILQINKHTILGAGNDYADFQYLSDIIKQKM